MKDKVLEFIMLCISTFGGYEDMSGGCYKFSLLLISVFGGEMLYDNDHVITKINGKYYDIGGIVTDISNFLLVDGKDYSEQELKNAYKEYL